ncbi:MAG: dihydroxyacetone kinase [Hyphomicrobiales bacterium]|nr:MAG: dihydroxyacetone kinase [Hyphomicrobiales bacterium]
MKKMINDPDQFVDEMLDGLCAAHPQLVRDPGNKRVVYTRSAPIKDKVGIVSGGGSGHLPLFVGYVGNGLLDACSIGEVFAGPTVDSCEAAIRAANGGAGVLCLYGNYGGDRMNFDLASEFLADEGIEIKTVLGTDDIASASPAESEKRRGVAGIVYAFKAAGTLSARGANLEDVARIAQKAVDRCRTIGCALSPCQIPGADSPNFEIADDEIEMGMGIHGEPGIWRDKLKSADAIADEMVERLLAEAPTDASGRISVLVNSLGATPLEELYILYRRIRQQTEAKGLQIIHPLVGHFVTSMEMAGASLSVIHLDDELEELLAAPADCPFWKV